DDCSSGKLRTKGKVVSFVVAIAVLVLLFSPYPGVSALTINFSAITNISLPIQQDGPSIELSANLILLSDQTLQIDHLEVIVDGDQTHPLIYDEDGVFLGSDLPKVLVAKGTPFPTKGEITIGDGYGYGTGVSVEGYLGPNTLPYVLEALPSQYATGTHTLQFVAVDKDTHKIPSSEIEFTIIQAPAPTQVTLSSLLNPSNSGQPVTLSSAVTGASPTGTVVFLDGSSTLGTGVLDGTGIATLVIPSLSVGSHTITAVYSGDSTNLGSTSNQIIQIIAQIPLDTVFPESYNQFDPVSKDVKVYGTDNIDGNLGSIAPASVTKTKWHTKYDDENGRQYDDDDDDEHDGQNDKKRGHTRATNAELRTYVITDHAGNSLTLTEVVKHKGNQIKVKVTSIRYGDNPAITPKLATKSFEWSLNKNGSIKELEQKMTVGQGKTKQDVEAKYDSKKNQTKIKSEKPRSERTESGMVLLQMHTDNGNLVIKDTS
ncbi:MAG TPA: Ig-like domain-containing protein, partial [Candidatus Nitrosotenuis sp.]|nr:Ig-like domain-containing protein [Candidatus Nitrosotenuis sp.]